MPFGPEQLLVALSPVLANEDGELPQGGTGSHFAHGELVGATLRRLAERFSHYIAALGYLPGAFEATASRIERAAAPERVAMSREEHPLSPAQRSHPVWVAFCPLHQDDLETEPDGVMTIRLALLVLSHLQVDELQRHGEEGDFQRNMGLGDLPPLTWNWKKARDVRSAYDFIDAAIEAIFQGIDLPPNPPGKDSFGKTGRAFQSRADKLIRMMSEAFEGRLPLGKDKPKTPPTGTDDKLPEKPVRKPAEDLPEVPPKVFYFDGPGTRPIRMPRPTAGIPTQDLAAEDAGTTIEDGTRPDEEILDDDSVSAQVTAAILAAKGSSTALRDQLRLREHHLRVRGRLQLGSDYAALPEELTEFARILFQICPQDDVTPRGQCATQLLLSETTRNGMR